MKKVIYIALLLISCCFASCEYDLDINENPNSPTSTTPDLRLPPILNYAVDIWGSHGLRAGMLTQQVGTVRSTSSRYGCLQNWQFQNNADVYVWQSWYIYTWINIKKMYGEAEKTNAYHYIGVGKAIEAFGVGMLADAYGLANYDQACMGVYLPKYQDTEYLYGKILATCDEAVDYLKMQQPEAAPALSEGDIIYKGDTQQWIKFVYAIKARLLSHLTKKKAYNPTEVLALIEKSFSSNADDPDIPYTLSSISNNNCINWQNTSKDYFVGKLYTQYVLNTIPGDATKSWSSGVVDPRADYLLPKIEEGDLAGEYTGGVDVKNTEEPKADNPIYVGLTTPAPKVGRMYYTQGDTPFGVISYSELLFIKAETLYRQSKKVEALSAYKDAIKANCQKIGVADDQIAKFLASAAVAQSAEELTLTHIMTQKYITLIFSPETWTDMRRCDFCCDATGKYNEEAGVYKGFDRPANVYKLNFPTDTSWPRRYQMSYVERDYNKENLVEFGVYDNDYMTRPIWWDTPDK